MKTQNFCTFRLGYDCRVLCSPAKAGALITLLAECAIVSTEWMEGMSDALVIKDEPIDMKLGPVNVMTRAEYDALREEQRKAKENAELQS